MKKNLLTIGEISKLTGVHTKSLSYYEKMGLLKPKFVDPNSAYRYYSVNQVYIVGTIKFAVEMGIPLKELAVFLEDEDTINFSHFLDHVKTVAQEQIDKISASINFARSFEKSIELSNAHPINQIYRRHIKEQYLYVLPCDSKFDQISSNDMVEMFIKPPYEYDSDNATHMEYGFLLEKTPQHTKRYVFVEAPKEKANYTIKAGHSTCIQQDDLYIEDAENIFDEHIKDKNNYIAIAAELYTEKVNIFKPVYELRIH